MGGMIRFRTALATLDVGAVLPGWAEVVEDFRPLPIVMVRGPAHRLGDLTSVPGVQAVSDVSAEIVAMVRCFAEVLKFVEHLKLRIVNGLTHRYSEGVAPGYPVLVGKTIEFDPQARRIGPGARAIVVNFSQELPTILGPELAVNHPLRCAIERTLDVAQVVVAAGRGTAANRSQLSAFARIPGVVVVGATTDAAGTQLDDRSARGEPGEVGPTVCAYGWSKEPQPRFGTSFAAPRVAMELVVIGSFLVTVENALRGDERDSVPLGALAIIDEGGHRDFKRHAIGALPVGLGMSRSVGKVPAEARGRLLAVLDDAAIRRASIEILRRSAKPMGRLSHEVGSGFVDERTIGTYLARLTFDELFEVVGAGPAPAGLAKRRVGGRDIGPAAAVWRQSSLVAIGDLENGRISAQ
jgi:hypothetical protein